MKPLRWIGSAQKDLRSFPAEVRGDVGHALYAAQMGETDPAAKPLRGFGGHSVMEIIAPFDGNTWRTVYTVRFRDVVYVLHAFQKKSKSGISTPKAEIDLIHERLARAERHFRENEGLDDNAI
jgi:phage-related protein